MLDTDQDYVAAVRFSSDGRWALCMGSQPAVAVWDMQKRKITRRLNSEEIFRALADGCVSRDGRRALTWGDRHDLYLWDLEQGRFLKAIYLDTLALDDRITALALSNDGKRGLVSVRKQGVYIVDLNTGKPVHLFAEHDGNVNCLLVTGDGRSVVSGGSDGEIRLWRLPE
ncbi:MAG: WD40 repeat domain-containing protein [Gemmataceae bacterium]